MDEENAAKFIDSGIDQINFSFDVFRREEYNRIRIGLDYDKVVSNIERFLEMKRDSNSSIHTIMTFVCLDQNEHEAKLFKKKWKGKIDKVLITFARDWAGQMKVNIGRKKTLLTADNNICKALWKDFVILQDGSVALCCNDYEGLGKMGNLNDQTIDEIWNGEKFIHYRKYQRQGRRKELNICNKCDSYSYWWIK